MSRYNVRGRRGQVWLGLLRNQYRNMSLSLFVRNAVIGWALVLAMSSPTGAQVTFTTNGPQYAIGGLQPGDQANPTAAIGPAGGFLMWQDNAIDGFGQGIGARALDGNFQPVGRAFRVNQIVGGDQVSPQGVLLPGGGAVFVWQGGAPSRQNIYARFLSASNAWLTGDVLVNTFTGNFKRQPVVVALANGNVVVAWGSYNQQSSSSLQDIYAQILTPTGTKVGTEFLVNEFTPFNQRTAAIAGLSTGGFVIVWVSEQQTHPLALSLDANTQYSPTNVPSIDIFARTFDVNGVALADEFVVDTDTVPCDMPSAAGDSSGGFVVTWTEMAVTAAETEGLNVFSRPFTSVGTGGQVRMVNTYTGSQYASHIAWVSPNYLTVWTSNGQDGSGTGVYGQLLNQDGSPSGSEFRVNTLTVGNQLGGTVVSDGGGRFLGLWTSFGSLASGFDISAQLYAPAGYVPPAPVNDVFAAPVTDPFPIIYPPTASPLPAVASSSTNNPTGSDPSNPMLDTLAPLMAGNAPSNGLAQAQGTYNGLVFNVTNVTVGTSGFFSAKTTASGGYSGSLVMGGASHSISGKFNASGLATNTVRLTTGQTLTVQLKLDLSGSDRLTGVISEGSLAYVAQVDADRLVFSAKTNSAPLQGNYTMAIPPAAGGPAGYGYGTLTVAPSGVVSWKANLADGTAVNQSSAVSKDGLWPLYVPLYKGTGAIISWMQFDTNQPESDVSGQLVWMKPLSLSGETYNPGFTNAVVAVGSAYTASAGGPMLSATNLNLIFSSGGLGTPLTNSFSLSRQNQAVAPAGQKLNLAFTAATGLFKGTTVNPATGQNLSFQGVVYEKAASGAGVFSNPAPKGQTPQNGQVYLGLPPSGQ